MLRQRAFSHGTVDIELWMLTSLPAVAGRRLQRVPRGQDQIAAHDVFSSDELSVASSLCKQLCKEISCMCYIEMPSHLQLSALSLSRRPGSSLEVDFTENSL